MQELPQPEPNRNRPLANGQTMMEVPSPSLYFTDRNNFASKLVLREGENMIRPFMTAVSIAVATLYLGEIAAYEVTVANTSGHDIDLNWKPNHTNVPWKTVRLKAGKAYIWRDDQWSYFPIKINIGHQPIPGVPGVFNGGINWRLYPQGKPFDNGVPQSPYSLEAGNGRDEGDHVLIDREGERDTGTLH